MAYLLKNKSNEFIKYNGKHVIGKDTAGVYIKAVNLESRTLDLIGTDESQDRDGDIITHRGWNFENFYKNPVFLWAHDYESVPLARTLKIMSRSKTKRHDFTMQFPAEGLNPFADMILNLYNERVINASSVGFIPTKMEDIEKEDDKEERPFFGTPKRFLEKELLELSGCPVPCNPNAVQDMLTEKLYSGYKGKDIFEEYKKGNILGLHYDDVLEELQVKDFQLIEKDTAKKFYNNKPAEGFKSFVVEEKEENQEENKENKQNEFEKFAEVLKNFMVQVDDEQRKKIESIITISDIDINTNQKSGAVLNKKNMNLLTSAIDNINQVLESAKKEEPDPVKESEDKKDIGDSIKIKEVLKPYPEEHACRLQEPGDYESFARKNCAIKPDGKCIDHIYGVKEGKSELQAMRYKKDIWTADAARNHCQENNGKFEAASKEYEPNKANIYDEILKDKETPNQVSQSIKANVNQERALEATTQELCSALKKLQEAIQNWK